MTDTHDHDDSQHPCITHALNRLPRADRPRPCFRKGQHYAACEHEHCRGCVPRSAQFGLLCPVCRLKVEDALSRAVNLIAHLRSIDRAGQAVGERVDASKTNRIILPESWLIADGLLEALGAPHIPPTIEMRNSADVDTVFALARAAVSDWSDLEPIVSTREGAKRAVVLVKRMQVAMQRFPDSEADWRYVPLMLCPSCGQATLHRRGPLEQGDDLVIQCAGSNLMYEQGIGYDSCEYQLDWFVWLETYSRPIEAAFAIHRKD